MLPTMLFLYNELERDANRKIWEHFGVSITTDALECIQKLTLNEYSLVGLEDSLSSWDVIHFLAHWPNGKRKPRVYIYSNNAFAANLMVNRLAALDFLAEWKIPDDHKSPHISRLP